MLMIISSRLKLMGTSGLVATHLGEATFVLLLLRVIYKYYSGIVQQNWLNKKRMQENIWLKLSWQRTMWWESISLQHKGHAL